MTQETLMFSVLCATFNQAAYLEEMLESICSQTRDDFEVVIVDDGSSDDTQAVLGAWRARQSRIPPERVTIVRTSQGGQSAAYERGFAETRGEWICLLDSDDTFVPHKLETIAQAVKDREDVGMVQHPLLVVDPEGTPTGDLRPQAATLSSGDLRAQMAVDARHVAPGASGLVIRRSTFEKLVPIATKRFRFAADAYLSFGAAASAPILALPHPLARYRMHPNGQYMRRMLSAEGLSLQVEFQETVARHFDLAAAAQRNSFFCRNVFASRRLNGQPESLAAWGRLLRATLRDAHFSRRQKLILMAFWCVMVVLPRPLFARAWRAFQMRQTGWRRVHEHRALPD